MVKFERPEDDTECARREAAWLSLAADAGLEIPEHEVLALGAAGSALATRRFDRQPRRHLLVVFRNNNDHLKNLAWLYDGVRWRLSPAYDLTFSPLPDRSSPVGGHTRDVPREALLALGTNLGLRAHEAAELLQQVLDAAATVGTVLRAYDCTGPTSRLAERAVTERLGTLAQRR